MTAPEPVAALVAAFGTTWSARDVGAALELWDLTDPAATYLGAGASRPMIGAAAIRAHVERTCADCTRIVMRPGPVHGRLLNEALALAFFPLAWARAMHTQKPFGGRVRATLLMRRSDKAWRIFHYAEAPLAPLITLRQFYEAIAADGLDAIPRWSGP